MQPFVAAGAAPRDKNYLFDELITQIHQQALRWRLIVIVGEPGDPTNDPSIGWPVNREQVDVGMLTLDRVEAEEFQPRHGHQLRPADVTGGYGRLRTIRCSALVRQSMRDRSPGAPARPSSRARSHPRT